VTDDFMPMEEMMMEAVPADIDWTFITYAGIISNGKRIVGLATIHGREQLVREGQSVDGVRFVRIQKDQVRVEYNDQVHTIYQQPQQRYENETTDNAIENQDPMDGSDYGGM